MIPLRNLKRFLAKTRKQPLYALRIFLRRLAAEWDYLFGQGKSRAPEALTLFLTHRCNLRCKMCGQWGEGGVTKRQGQEILKEELSLAEIKKCVDELAQALPSITLFGGEPLLFSGCAELIRYIKTKAMHCLLITNGSLLEGVAEELVEAGLDELNVSLDAGEQLHDEIRGQPGVFAKIISGLEKVNYFKAQKHKPKPLINLQCTINKFNYLHLEQLVEVAIVVKANALTFHNLIFLSQTLLAKQKTFDAKLGSSSQDWEGFVADAGIDPLRLEEKIKEILSLKHDFSIDFYPNFSQRELAEYYNNPDFSPVMQSQRCLSPWLVAYVFPDGEVRPCLNFSYSFGNIKAEPFLKIWNNPRARRFRRMLKRNKIFPVCVRCTELYRY